MEILKGKLRATLSIIVQKSLKLWHKAEYIDFFTFRMEVPKCNSYTIVHTTAG